MAGAGLGDADTSMPLVTLLPGHLELPDDMPPLYLDSTLEIRPGDRWLVTGPNGAGKTTLLRVLAGELGDPRHRQTSAGLRVSWLRQSLATPDGDGRTALVDAFARASGMYREDATAALGTLGLFPPDALTGAVADLSVGQRRRLELAVTLTAPGDLLLLDEPTNHLTPELVEQLEEALVDFPGAVVTVTHDRRWLTNARHRDKPRELRITAGSVAVTR
jgi:macrolide transport system ATP-binding/permease protein